MVGGWLVGGFKKTHLKMDILGYHIFINLLFNHIKTTRWSRECCRNLSEDEKIKINYANIRNKNMSDEDRERKK